jgi:hypothetical protein
MQKKVHNECEGYLRIKEMKRTESKSQHMHEIIMEMSTLMNQYVSLERKGMSLNADFYVW